MDNFKKLISEMQGEIEKLNMREDDLNKRTLELEALEDGVKQEYLSNAKTAQELSDHQKETQVIRTDLETREGQILIREKSIQVMTSNLKSEKDLLRKKEQEIIEREVKLAQKEKDFIEWEGKIKLANEQVEHDRVLLLKDKAFDDIRKKKIARKEEQVESELTRIRSINI